jgi:hypothetical protein
MTGLVLASLCRQDGETAAEGLNQILLRAKSPEHASSPTPGDGKPEHPFAAKGANPPAVWYI